MNFHQATIVPSNQADLDQWIFLAEILTSPVVELTKDEMNKRIAVALKNVYDGAYEVGKQSVQP